MISVFDPNFRYAAGTGEGVCALQLFFRPGSAQVVGVVTELDDNGGASVTTEAEGLIRQIVGGFKLDPASYVHIEHYPATRGELGTVLFDETFSRVVFRVEDGGIVAGSTVFTPVGVEELAELTGTTAADWPSELRRPSRTGRELRVERERTAFIYTSAVDRCDVRTIAAVLEVARRDDALAEIIAGINDELARELGIGASANPLLTILEETAKRLLAPYGHVAGERVERLVRRASIIARYRAALDSGDAEEMAAALADAYQVSGDDPAISDVVSAVNRELAEAEGLPPVTEEDAERVGGIVRHIIEREGFPAPAAAADDVRTCPRHGTYFAGECPGCDLERRHPDVRGLYDAWLRRTRQDAPDAHLEGRHEELTDRGDE